MLELRDQLTMYVESVESAIDSADRLLWHISIVNASGRWAVVAGDKALIVTDNQEVANAFVYGMGLAYSVIPEDVTEAYLEDLGLREEYEQMLLDKQQNKEGGN